jgi:hypothetical protein
MELADQPPLRGELAHGEWGECVAGAARTMFFSSPGFRLKRMLPATASFLLSEQILMT